MIEGRGLRSKAAIIGCPDLPSDLAGGGPIVEPEPDEGAKRPPPYNPNATLDLTLLSETLHVTAREQGEAKKRGKTQARAKANPNLKRLALWVEAQKQYRTKEQTKWKRCRYFVRPSDSKVVAACRRITGRGYRDHLTVKPFETRYWRWDGRAKDWRYEKFSGETIWAKEICMRCGLFQSVKDVQEE